MTPARSIRRAGVGLEVTNRVVRGVHLVEATRPHEAEHGEAPRGATPGGGTGGHDAGQDDPVRMTGEVPLRAPEDDRSILDSLIRLRAELEHPDAPTRIAVFGRPSVLRRLDVTGATGNELNEVRTELDRTEDISSTVLLDDGPRRWMLAIRWSSTSARRLEALAERAGFLDVAIDPSPVALARVLPRDTRRVRRTGPDESFDLVVHDGVPIAAAATEGWGDLPRLAQSDAEVEPGWFDVLTDPSELVTEIGAIVDESSIDDALVIGRYRYPPYPTHDLRAPARVCVALGAAVGAAGLAGRLRPLDVVDTVRPTLTTIEFPWVIERRSELPDATPTSIGPVKRFVASVLPRRRRR